MGNLFPTVKVASAEISCFAFTWEIMKTEDEIDLKIEIRYAVECVG